jgi:acetyl-CoA acetyltransferase
MDVIELNEAFAAQGLAVTRDLGLADDAPHVNPNGGAIAIGHPLGASGARLVLAALHQLERTGGRYALCTMCIGVAGHRVIERVSRVVMKWWSWSKCMKSTASRRSFIRPPTCTRARC